jgi:hypothetical protein
LHSVGGSVSYFFGELLAFSDQGLRLRGAVVSFLDGTVGPGVVLASLFSVVPAVVVLASPCLFARRLFDDEMTF